MLGEKISHYQVLERLSQGGMGEVYRAHDLHLDRDVAIKILPEGTFDDPDARRRFRQGALALSQLNHPNIAIVHDFDIEGGVEFLVMEFIEGRDLARLLRDHPGQGLDEQECLWLADQVAAALEEAHRQGVVHRDLKPQNIMLADNGQVKVLDFGLAKVTTQAGEDEPTLAASQAGTITGTLPYMPPEQALGDRVDRRADIYSWAATVYELTTGSPPFGDKRGAELVVSIARDRPLPPRMRRPGLSPWFDAMLMKALSKDPAERQYPVGRLREEIAAHTWAAGTGPEGPRRKVRASVAGLLALLSAATLGAWWLRSTHVPPPAAPTSVAVLPFDLAVDTGEFGALGDTVGDMVAEGLSRAPWLQVVDGRGFLEQLPPLADGSPGAPDGAAALALMHDAGVARALIGTILQVEPRYVMSARVVDVPSGQLLGSHRAVGEEGQELVAFVDGMLPLIRDGPPLGPGSQGSHPTSTAEARLHYLDGQHYRSLNYLTRARLSFEAAVEADSTFALAQLALGNVDAALRHIDGATQGDQQLIRAMDLRRQDPEAAIGRLEALVADYPEHAGYRRALTSLYFAHTDPRRPYGRTRAALRSARRELELDPASGIALHSLFYAYFRLGDFENSLRTLDRFVALGEANAYDDLGDFYAWTGQYGKAADAFAKAVAINPTYTTLVKEGFLHLRRRDYERARASWQRLARKKGDYEKTIGKRLLLVIPAYQGHLRDALRLSGTLLAAAQLVGEDGAEYRRTLHMRSHLHAEQGDWDAAVADCERAIESYASVAPGPNWYLHPKIRTLARAGRVGEARAALESSAADLRGGDALITRAWVAFAGGDPEGAFTLLDPLAPSNDVMERMVFTDDTTYGADYLLGLACLETGRLSRAVECFDRFLLQYYSLYIGVCPMKAVRAHYYKGLAYERSGWFDEAAASYREFLDIWRTADSGLRDLEDARVRLAELQGE